MTTDVTFGWDCSHYDGVLTETDYVRAKTQGIAFVTHKIGEGTGNTDPDAAEGLNAAKAAGIPILGGYWFLHGTDSVTAEVAALLATADRLIPWWKDFTDYEHVFFWQTDAETSSSGLPSPSFVRDFHDELADKSGLVVATYASAGMYGNRLAGLKGPLWNANYGSNPHGSFAAVYPGNSSAGWKTYSGQTPLLLQYGSNTSIAGHTTCDANAFRGDIDALHEALGGKVLTAAQVQAAAQAGCAAAMADPKNAAALLNNLLNGVSADQQRAVSAPGLANVDFTATPPNLKNQLGYTLQDIQTRVRSLCEKAGLPAHD